MLVLGIDDAGRGPVIGPMVLAGVLVDEQAEKDLKKLGVKDSKDLTSKRRSILASEIKDKAETFEIVLAPPLEIDKCLNGDINLNALEAIKIAEIINKVNKGYSEMKVIIDCPSVSIEKWKDFLKTKIHNLSNLEIVCEYKADQNHIPVSAASIIAKEVREKEMDKLKEIYGNEIGSGYCSDPNTKKFLEKFALKHQDSGIFRKSWQTWKNVLSNLGQKKLF